MLNWGASEFFGLLFFLPVFIYLTYVILDGLGIFRDVFKTRDEGEAENIFHHHFHYKSKR